MEKSRFNPKIKAGKQIIRSKGRNSTKHNIMNQHKTANTGRINREGNKQARWGRLTIIR